MKTGIPAVLILVVSLLSACDGDDNDKGSENNARVFIDNGAIQCESAGDSIGKTAQILQSNGIDVVDSQCGLKANEAVVAICGVEDIAINVHTIPTQNIPDAKALGFNPVSDLSEDGVPGYIVVDCAEVQ